MRRYVLVLVIMCMMAGMSQATVVSFYDNKTEFDAATTTTTIGFEGLAAANDHMGPVSSLTSAGVVFTSPDYLGELGVAGIGTVDFGSGVNETFDSSVLYADSDRYSILATLPANTTAVGGYFGYARKDAYTPAFDTTLTAKFDAAGDSNQTKSAIHMGVSGDQSFFGWTVDGGSILSIEQTLTATGFAWAGLDNFQVGSLNATTGGEVPEPASCVVWGLIGLSCIGAGWYRRRRAA